jgi:phosphomannomutase
LVSIYKPCDIRGNAATELTPELYASWGRTLGEQLPPGTSFVVGGDVRGSTPLFLAALCDGLVRAGMDVTDLGQLPTPMIYFAKRHRNAIGCAIVTASHNPATINGLKWMIGDRPPTPADVAALERGVLEPAASNRAPGASHKVDISSDYVAWLQHDFREASHVELRIVIDPMYGCWSGKAVSYLKMIFPRSEFVAIRNEADPTFGGRTPDCSRPHELLELGQAVRQQDATCGIAFDGDGDRVAFADNDGVPLSAEESTWILLHSFGDAIRETGFVYDQKFSDRIAEAASHLGAEPLVERSGHAFIRTRICDTGSLFGAEISGHYFYQSLGGGDDGLYTACRMIAYLAGDGRSMTELRRGCPPIFISPDLRVSVSAERQSEIVARIRERWAKYPQRTIDGIRVDTPDGWMLIRQSVTEAALTFRFEGRDRASLDRLVYSLCDAIPEIGVALRTKYEST